MYSARQRELRERRLHAARSGGHELVDEYTAIEIEEPDKSPAVEPIPIRLRRGATAA